MNIGLKHNTVELTDHDSKWETIASQTIKRLWSIFGLVATDIQHVGSTAIKRIKAKPIIDIAIAVKDFSKVEELVPALDKAGFLRRKWETDQQMLFAVGDYSNPDGIVTHFIHVVKADSEDWHNYINFRNYLNANISVAKAYEELKVKLATENAHDTGRKKYLVGKFDFIKQTIKAASEYENTQNIINLQSAPNEIWDIYDENRQLTGRTHKRIEPLQRGDYHLVVHVWIMNKNGEFLITKRSPNKGYPNMWESTGGSALSGDDSITAAIREVKEETGLDVCKENGKCVLTLQRVDNFCDVWLFKQEFNISNVILQETETSAAKAVTKGEIRQMIKNGEFMPFSYIEKLFELC